MKNRGIAPQPSKSVILGVEKEGSTSSFLSLNKSHPKEKKSTCNSYLNSQLNYSNITVNIEFHTTTPLEHIVCEICSMSYPIIILWYIGPFGLKQGSVSFYKENILNPILSQNSNARFFLLDLTAWNVFKTSCTSIDISSSCCSVIDRFPGGRVKCIKSSEILQKIRDTRDRIIADYFRIALRKNFVRKASLNHPEVGFKLKDIFSENNPILNEWEFLDAAKAYSMVQYLEGCFLIDEIVAKAIETSENREIEIALVLPNDELKYYQGELNAFKNDVRFLISQRLCFQDSSSISVIVHFYSFSYGIDPIMRPYNAPGAKYRKNKLTFDKIADFD